jgi:hypothetical protein
MAKELPRAVWNITAKIKDGAFSRHKPNDLPVRMAKPVTHPVKRRRTVRVTAPRRFIAN